MRDGVNLQLNIRRQPCCCCFTVIWRLGCMMPDDKQHHNPKEIMLNPHNRGRRRETDEGREKMSEIPNA